MPADNHGDGQVIVLDDDAATRTEAHIRHAEDGPHVRLVHRIEGPGRVTETRPFTITPAQIAVFAALFGRLHMETRRDPQPAGPGVLIGDDGYCRTEAYTWQEDDGTHVRITQRWRHLNGREASTQLTGFKDDEITALADLFAQVRDENGNGTVHEFVRAARLALAGYAAASDAEAPGAADALANAVDSLLCQKLSRTLITGGDVVHCGCGHVIEEHNGVWLHTLNPDIIGHDDQWAKPVEDQ
jgi:hypothetical protein